MKSNRLKFLPGAAWLLLALVSLAIPSGDVSATVLPFDSLMQGDGQWYQGEWYFHADDNMAWADPEFNDSSWLRVTTVGPHESVPGNGWQGIGWFRLHVAADSSQSVRQLGLLMALTGAAEVYINGALVASFGRVGHSAEEELFEIHDPQAGRPTSIDLHGQQQLVIAVRFSNFGYESSLHAKTGFLLSFADPVEALAEHDRFIQSTIGHQMFFTGLALAFCVLHLLMYIFYRPMVANLYYALFTAAIAGMSYAPAMSVLSHDRDVWMASHFGLQVSIVAVVVFGLLSMYSVFGKRIPRQFWFFAGGGLILVVVMRYLPRGAIYAYAFVGLAELTRVIVVGILGGKKRSWIIGTGFMLFVVASFYQMLSDLLPIVLPIHATMYTYMFGILALLISMSVYLAGQFAQINTDLGLQLDQVRELSDTAVRQERKAKEQEMTRKLLEKELEHNKARLEEAARLEKALADLEKAHLDLSHSSSNLRAILDSSFAVNLLVNREGIITTVNKCVEEFFGLKPDIVTGLSFESFCDRIESSFEDPESFRRLLAESIGNVDDCCQPSWAKDKLFEQALKLHSPQVRHVVFSTTAVSDEKGRQLGHVWMFHDITPLVRADEQLRAIVDASPVPTIVSRVDDGLIRYANDQLAQMIGSTTVDLIGKVTPDFYYDPADREYVLNELRTSGSLHNHEVRLKRSDGSVFWSMLSVVVTELADEKVIVGGVYDIDYRKQAEEAVATRLRYEEGLAACSRTCLTSAPVADVLDLIVRHLLKASSASRVYIFENFEDPVDGLCMQLKHEACADGVAPTASPDLRHMPYSRGFERWREQLSHKQPIHGTISELHPDERKILDEEGTKSVLILPILDKDHWHGFIGFDECESERQWSKEDISALETAAEMIAVFLLRRQVEESLRLSEERFRGLVENANDIIYSMSPDGRFTYVSPKIRDIIGYSVAECIDKPVASFIHPDDVDAMKDWVEGGYQKVAAGHVEFRMMHKDGSPRWFVSDATVIRSDDGEVLEAVGVAHDITEMKRLLDELSQTNRHLQDTQAQLVQSEKMASMGQLVAGVAHEINTPIGAVSSMHDTLMRAVDKLVVMINQNFECDDLTQKRCDSLLRVISDANKVIKEGTDRVTTIVRRLRSFARLDEAELKRVDLHEGIDDTLMLIHHQIKNRIEVVRDYGDLPKVACYPGQLNQVWLNLLNNARQAIEGKGTITISTGSADGMVTVTITDSGSGISKGHMAKVFDPGFTTKGVGVGTGLGLSICYQIVQGHKGQMECRNTTDSGAEFKVRLPVDLDQEPDPGTTGSQT